MVLLCLRCQKIKEKQYRGDVAVGLSGHIWQDTQIGPILTRKWLQNLSQNGIRNCVKIKLRLWMFFGARKSPKMEPKWSQNWSQACARAILGPLGAILGPRGAILGHIWHHVWASLIPFLGLFGAFLGPRSMLGSYQNNTRVKPTAFYDCFFFLRTEIPTSCILRGRRQWA